MPVPVQTGSVAVAAGWREYGFLMVTKAKFAPALRGGTWMVVLALVTLTSCKTKSEIRREQELARLKSEIRAVRGNKADASVAVEELRGEVARLANVL